MFPGRVTLRVFLILYITAMTASVIAQQALAILGR
jgi:hypothetical protein